jgi:vitamin K-dependent gamma-carboxylase
VQMIKGSLTKLRARAFTPVDIASLVFFRIAFGLLMVCHIWRYFSHGAIASYWIEPSFLFKYYGFSWVHPWPGNGLYIHCAALGLLALFIAAGFLYRLSTILFFLGYTYTFLLDEAGWVNHRYLICLFGFLLIFVPANRAFSIDAWVKPRLRSQSTPAWTLWLLGGQMGVVYFFAGIAKITPDWLHGEPMRIFLAATDFNVMGRFFSEPWAVYAFSYAALLLDLFVVPFLLWRRTRLAAFCTVSVFHLLNGQLFDLQIFPWLAIAATTLFLSPSWPRRIIAIFRKTGRSVPFTDFTPVSHRKQSVILLLVTMYLAIQVLVPLRHFLYRGGIEWYYSEHRFSWRMMIQSQRVRAYFYVTDPNSGNTFQIDPHDYLEGWQTKMMGWRPDMLVQFARYLAKVMPQAGPKPLKVEARVFASINGRKPQMMIDQNVDLAAEARTLGRPRWLLEIHEPLPEQPGDPLEDPFLPRLETGQ